MANRFSSYTSRHKIMSVVLGVALLIPALMLLDSFFGSQSPNFYAVRNEARNFEVPSDWVETGYTEERGTLGLWCYRLGGGECPYYSITYEALGVPSEGDYESLINLLERGGYTYVNGYKGRCNTKSLESGIYSCIVEGVRGKNRMSISSHIDDSTKEGTVRHSVGLTR